MESGIPEGKTGDTATPKKDGKRGENVKFYLQPEDVFALNKAMQEDHFDARGHYLMHLLKQREVWADWRRIRTREILKEVVDAGLTVEDLRN